MMRSGRFVPLPLAMPRGSLESGSRQTLAQECLLVPIPALGTQPRGFRTPEGCWYPDAAMLGNAASFRPRDSSNLAHGIPVARRAAEANATSSKVWLLTNRRFGQASVFVARLVSLPFMVPPRKLPSVWRLTIRVEPPGGRCVCICWASSGLAAATAAVISARRSAVRRVIRVSPLTWISRKSTPCPANVPECLCPTNKNPTRQVRELTRGPGDHTPASMTLARSSASRHSFSGRPSTGNGGRAERFSRLSASVAVVRFEQVPGARHPETKSVL